MSKPYLILHKVRGEPAFDVAENIGSEEDGDLWIIPTSGHRAYPYYMWPIENLTDLHNHHPHHMVKEEMLLQNLSSLRDHYVASEPPPPRQPRHLPPTTTEDFVL